ASRFAMDLLIPPAALDHFIETGSFSQQAIREFATEQGIAPGIVVGRLQHEGRLDWKLFRSLKKTFSWESWPRRKGE
ncbi:MAG TPA: hypothetical protein V6D17_09930, partial [Candidatus Obscuribacterales bacterium]